MPQGKLLGIFLAPQHGVAPHSVVEAEAVAGRGLVGDRHFLQEGKNKPAREVTLIESEALEALAAGSHLRLTPAQSRRNLLTRGTPLNLLVGVTFHIGEVTLRGVELCDPCGHLEKLTRKGVKAGLRQRGGLRAQVLCGGWLRVGDIISGDS